MPEKIRKLGLKTLAILPNHFGYIFMQLKQKARLRPELSPKFLSTLGPNPNPTRKARPDLQPWGGVLSLTTACAPHFDLLKILFLEHHVTARQQTMIKNE